MKIQVTQEDIDKSRRFSRKSCPVSLAIQRVVKAREVEVYSRQLVIDHIYKIDLPASVQSFITRFDLQAWHKNKNEIRPFTFDLKLPMQMKLL